MNTLAALLVDGYKLGHTFQYPKGTDKVYSNFTPRSFRLFKGSSKFDDKYVAVGMNAVIEEITRMWDKDFFSRDKNEVVEELREELKAYFGQEVSVEHFADLHDVGYLPILVKALPEGSRVGAKVPVLTITNTIGEFYWIVNALETIISNMLWKPITAATIAFEYRRILQQYAKETGDESFVDFQAHDFSYRGTGVEDGARLGLGHLALFKGTDTVPAIKYVKEFYCAGDDHLEEIIGCSVPATEHAVSSANIMFEIDNFGGDPMNDEDRLKGETLWMKRYITELYPTGIASYVADTYDFWGVLTKVLPQLKDEIMSRDGKLVLRPDSGDPVDVICGLDVSIDVYMSPVHSLEKVIAEKTKDDYRNLSTDTTYFKFDNKYFKVIREYYSGSSETYGKAEEMDESEVAELKGSIETLWDLFGGTVNEKGYKVLHPSIGLIYGDSITIQRTEEICKRLKAKGFATTNVVLGVGSYTYQYNTRDTLGMAMKATYLEVDGKSIDLFKDPKTDKSGKKSAKGLLRVELEDGEFVLYDEQTLEQEKEGVLQIININEFSFMDDRSIIEIRKRLLKELE